jgi:hypothetical protein
MKHDPETGEVLDFDFAGWLADFGGGDANTAISKKMAQLNAAVETVGDKGKLTLSFEVAPHKRGEGVCQVTLTSVKISEPMEPVNAEPFYHAAGGGLSRVAQGPPKQPEFSFDNVTSLDKDRKTN